MLPNRGFQISRCGSRQNQMAKEAGINQTVAQRNLLECSIGPKVDCLFKRLESIPPWIMTVAGRRAKDEQEGGNAIL
jgi:hypothetical protein